MAPQARLLSTAVAQVFARLGISVEELLSGPLRITELDWQVPPLRSEIPLNKTPFYQYMETSVKVNEEAFESFWGDTMYDMRNRTQTVWLKGTYRRAYDSLNMDRATMRYWLAQPDGAPAQIGDYVGAVFSMECATILLMAGGGVELVSNSDDYYVKTLAGREVGVRGGLPIIGGEEWDISVAGIVPELLEQSRGSISTACDYDIIAKVRSTLWERRFEIVEFDGAELALQALRVMDGGKYLLQALRGLKTQVKRNTTRISVLKSGLRTLNDPGLSDRQKLTTVKEALVPEALSKGEFSNLIYNYSAPLPPNVPLKKMKQAVANLEHALQQEEDRYANKV